jgi:hypothetical protein
LNIIYKIVDFQNENNIFIMYNMNTDIIVFGNKFSIWTIIIIGIIISILWCHLIIGCMTDHPYNVFNRILLGFNDTMNNNIMKYQMNPVGASIPYREGFTNSVLNTSNYTEIGNQENQPINTQNWGAPNLTYIQGQQPSSASLEIINRPNQSIDLNSGEMDFFANTQFSPKCCPSTYSNSEGCACLSVNQYNNLIQRGGNNVPYSQY